MCVPDVFTFDVRTCASLIFYGRGFIEMVEALIISTRFFLLVFSISIVGDSVMDKLCGGAEILYLEYSTAFINFETIKPNFSACHVPLGEVLDGKLRQYVHQNRMRSGT